MTEHLTDEQIEALAAAATPGPWRWDYPGSDSSELVGTGGDENYSYETSVLAAEHDGGCGCRSACTLTVNLSDADAAFIAAARTLVPSLLARAQKAEAERDEAIRDLEAGDACGAVGCRALEDRDRLLAELANAQRYIEQRDDAHGRIVDENRALAARLASAEADIAEWYEREGDLLEEAKRLRSQLLTAEAKLAAVEKLCEPQSASEAAYPVRNDGRLIKVGDIRAALAADTPPEPAVEVGGQVMTQAQFDAARFPLLHPAPEPTEPTRCAGTLGKPSWMSDGQFSPCRCELPAGHDGEHQCEHIRPAIPEQEAGD